uniref:Uncharacterized protein n=1 Tax=Arundo donax TaxID=35708 RepID=A0A0A9EMP6_ARUDO
MFLCISGCVLSMYIKTELVMTRALNHDIICDTCALLNQECVLGNF